MRFGALALLSWLVVARTTGGAGGKRARDDRRTGSRSDHDALDHGDHVAGDYHTGGDIDPITNDHPARHNYRR